MLELLQKAGLVAYPLAIFSVLALAIILERLVMLARLGNFEEAAFKNLIQQLTGGGELKLDDPVIEGAPVTVVIKTVAAMRGASEESKQTAAEIAVSMQRLRLRKYLGLLATIGSVSPFVGLFGTVLGVLYSFQSMQSQGMGGEKMAAGIGEALSATAIGLGVAIPSVMAYNYFTGRIQGMVLSVHAHVAQIIPLLEGNSKPRAFGRRPDMHAGHRDEDEPMADMNLIPLIDIALTLLIILMVTTAFVHRPGVNLNLPKTVTREGAPETDKDLAITVSAAGSLYIDGKQLDDPTVQTMLTAAARKDKDARVLVKGDRTVPYARVMDVMDMARQAGLTRITLPTDPKTLTVTPGLRR